MIVTYITSEIINAIKDDQRTAQITGDKRRDN